MKIRDKRTPLHVSYWYTQKDGKQGLGEGSIMANLSDFKKENLIDGLRNLIIQKNNLESVIILNVINVRDLYD